MTMTEQAAYLKGLADGMKLSEKTGDEQRLLQGVVDLLGEMARRVDANLESINTLADELDELDDTVSGLEESMVGMEDLEDLEEEDETTEYELECPECAQPVVLTEADLSAGEINCPNCGAKLSIDVDFEDEDDSPEA